MTIRVVAINDKNFRQRSLHSVASVYFSYLREHRNIFDRGENEDFDLKSAHKLIAINTESSPYPRGVPSGRGGHRVSWSGCRHGRRFAERLQECRHFQENS